MSRTAFETIGWVAGGAFMLVYIRPRTVPGIVGVFFVGVAIGYTSAWLGGEIHDHLEERTS